MSTTEILLLAMLIIFSVPHAAWPLARTGCVAPPVVVQIVGGILLGKAVITGATFTAPPLTALASTMPTVPMVTPRLARPNMPG